MKNVKKLSFTGMFAAIIFVLTMFVKIPVASGYVHIGDTMVYLCACIIGSPLAILAAVVGEGLADIAGGYAMYAPATAILKAIIALLFLLSSKNSNKILNFKNVIMSIIAGLITVGGYFLSDLIIDKTYAIVDIATNGIQAVASAVLFIVLAAAFDAVKIKNKINL